ncbi:MAG: Agmatinase [Dehalococcoidia bacterium]|nr:Agmatinase [Dehalococcoidia bacterium]
MDRANEQIFYPYRVFGGLYQKDADFQQARFVVLPVPYDSTTSYTTGTREGPQAIIDASGNMELYDIELGRELHHGGINTLPEVQPHMGNPQDMVDRVYQVVSDLLNEDKIVVMLGGEHSLSSGAVRAYKERYPALSVLHLDAHADMRDEYMGTKYSHACTARRIAEMCPITQMGIRSLSIEEHIFIQENRINTFFREERPLDESLLQDVISSLSQDVYITLDLDVLDPSIMSAVGTPEPGGLSWEEITAVLRRVSQERRIVGFDIMELCPHEGPVACAFTAAKLTYKLMGYAEDSWRLE